MIKDKGYLDGLKDGKIEAEKYKKDKEYARGLKEGALEVRNKRDLDEIYRRIETITHAVGYSDLKGNGFLQSEVGINLICIGDIINRIKGVSDLTRDFQTSWGEKSKEWIKLDHRQIYPKWDVEKMTNDVVSVLPKLKEDIFPLLNLHEYVEEMENKDIVEQSHIKARF